MSCLAVLWGRRTAEKWGVFQCVISMGTLQLCYLPKQTEKQSAVWTELVLLFMSVRKPQSL